jgi:hypothetical protein
VLVYGRLQLGRQRLDVRILGFLPGIGHQLVGGLVIVDAGGGDIVLVELLAAERVEPVGRVTFLACATACTSCKPLVWSSTIFWAKALTSGEVAFCSAMLPAATSLTLAWAKPVRMRWSPLLRFCAMAAPAASRPTHAATAILILLFMMDSSQKDDEELILQSRDNGGRTLRGCKNNNSAQGAQKKRRQAGAL